jgi:hypothetical protein
MSPLANAVSEPVAEKGLEIVTGVLAKAERDELIEKLGPVSGAGRRGILELAPI